MSTIGDRMSLGVIVDVSFTPTFPGDTPEAAEARVMALVAEIQAEREAARAQAGASGEGEGAGAEGEAAPEAPKPGPSGG
jgi:hypothetical protein